MPEASLLPMSHDAVAQWRTYRAGTGSSFPDPSDGLELEVLEILVGGTAVGGVVLSHTSDARPRTAIRLLETSLADDDATHWVAVLRAVESRALARGARTVVTAVPPRLVAAFEQVGYAATMTGVGIRITPERERVLPDDGWVQVREMTDDERRRFVPAAREILRSGMVRAGVLGDPDAPMDEVDQRLGGLTDDPPPDELLLTATLHRAPIGRFWGTRVERGGTVDLVGNTIDLFPEHRGEGLARHVMAALETYVREHGFRVVRGRLYDHERQARSTLLGMGVEVDDVHLRKDLAQHQG